MQDIRTISSFEHSFRENFRGVFLTTNNRGRCTNTTNRVEVSNIESESVEYEEYTESHRNPPTSLLDRFESEGYECSSEDEYYFRNQPSQKKGEGRAP